MAKAKAAAPASAPAPAPEPEKKPKAEPKPKEINGRGYGAKVTFGSDKEGKEYNTTDNNPKRRKAGERFALYKKNMTVQQAIDAGISGPDVKWDLDHGFIKFVD